MPGRLNHEELALRIARSMMRRLPAVVSRDDIEQAARIGLWRALEKGPGDHTPEQQRAYLSRRIRGAILDELRRQDWAPRRHRAKAQPPQIVRFDDLPTSPPGSAEERLVAPGDDPEHAALRAFDTARALEAPLDPKDREALRLVILRGEKQLVAAQALGISEARVNQRLHRALYTMRAWLEGSLDATTGGRPTHVSTRALISILEAHAERTNRQHRRPNRTPRNAPGRAPAPGLDRTLRTARLGRPPLAGVHRPVPGGAGAAELPGASLPRVRAARDGGGLVTPQQKQVVVQQAQRVAARLRSDIARLRAQGYDALEIAAELELPRETVEQVLTEPAPLRKCTP